MAGSSSEEMDPEEAAKIAAVRAAEEVEEAKRLTKEILKFQSEENGQKLIGPGLKPAEIVHQVIGNIII